MDSFSLRTFFAADKLLLCRRLTGAIVGVSILVLAALQFQPIHAPDAELPFRFLLIAAATGILGSGLDRMRLARGCGAFICLVALVILIDTLLSTRGPHSSHALLRLIGGDVSYSPAMQANKAMVYAMIGVALLAIESVESVFGRIILTSILGLIIFSVGALSMLGYSMNVGDVESWQLFAKISRVESVSFTAIGLTLIGLCWTRAQLEHASLASLGRATYIFTAVGVFTLALLSAGFGVLGLSETVLQASRSQVQERLLAKASELDHFLAKYRLLAAEVSNNPASLELLAKLSQQTVPAEEYRAAMNPTLEYTTSLNDEILGVARFDAQGKLIAGAGRQSDLAIEAANYTNVDAFRIIGPFTRNGQFYLFALNPVVDNERVRSGTDVFVLDAKPLRETIQGSREFGRAARLSLIALAGKARNEFYVSNGDIAMRDAGSFDESFQSGGQGRHVAGGLDPEDAPFVLRAPLVQAPWQINLSVPQSELLARSRKVIIHSLLAAALLAALSTALLLFFSRKLIAQTLQLKRQLVMADRSLQRESGRRERAERLARRKEKEARLISQKTNDAIVSFYCANGSICSFSPAAEEIFGYSEHELAGEKIDRLLPGLNLWSNGNSASNGGSTGLRLLPAGEREGQRKDGTRFPVDLSFEAATIDDQEICFGLLHDISERKRTEEKIRHSAKEKEVLLREVHHRVKNNLQIISSLFRLQSRRVMDQKICTLLEESQNRIQSIALVHETLYRSDDFSQIDMGTYLREIVNNLKRSLSGANQVEMSVEANDVVLALDFAIPCGLMVNELATNAIRHAFTPENYRSAEQPHIAIELDESGDVVTLTVKDNGVGLPEGFDFASARSLGMRLIQILCSQIDGALDVHNRQGSEFVVSFSNNTAGLSA